MLPHLSLNNFIMLFKNKGAKIAQSLVWLYDCMRMSVTITVKWRTLKELKRKNISLQIWIEKKVQRVSPHTTYRKYLSLGPFLSSPINKVYLVDIIPVCLCIIWTHYMNTLHCLYIVWTHVQPPCYMNTCTTSLLYEHMYDLLVIWTHVWLPCYMNTCTTSYLSVYWW